MSSDQNYSPLPLGLGVRENGVSTQEEGQQPLQAADDIAIRVSNVSKCHQIYDKPHDRLKQSLYPRLQRLIGRSAKQYHREFWALRDVSFEIKRGETVGIIGRNGSGKSTLLQMICGTLAPTSGTVETNGRIAALLELGSGFNPEFTGRENVYMNGALLGLTQEEIDERFDAIASFADIGQFIDQPVKTYSSGMSLRLAFAVQSQLDPDILIIDEALSVGDYFFQQKCFSYIRGLCAKGVTLLFVSHDLGTVRDICKRAIYLRQGNLLLDGNASGVISSYLGDAHTSVLPINLETTSPSSDLPIPTANFTEILRNALWRNQSQAVDKEGKLLAVAVCDKNGNANVIFRIGDTAVIMVVYVSKLSSECHASVTILNKFSQIVTVTGSYFSQASLPKDECGSGAFQIVICELRTTMFLEAGQYSLEVSTGSPTVPNIGIVRDKVTSLGPITVTWDYEHEVATFLGQVGLPVDCRFFVSPFKTND